MRRSTQWAICAAILFAASVAFIVAGLILRSGVVSFSFLLLVIGVGAVLASNRFRKLEMAESGSVDLSSDGDEPSPRNPRIRNDRAFNRIAMAQREAEMLASSGVDVTPARNLIAQAQGQFDHRDFDHAYESAQSAHEVLVAARSRRPLPSLRNGPTP